MNLHKGWGKIVLISFFSLLPIVSFAQVTYRPCETSGKICNPINEETITGFIKTLLEGFIKIGMPIIALAIIYSGFMFVFARGKPEELSKAKSALLYSLIGAVLLLGSWALAQLISNTVLAL